ncbi:MAG: nitrate reductase molybdenum cofactor assembly chaperone [Bilophila sp.]
MSPTLKTLPALSSDDRITLGCLSVLLRYPDETTLPLFSTMREELPLYCEPEAVRCLWDFLARLERHGVCVMQEEHVRTFDLDTACSPHLAWHRYGDDPRLGRALASLNELYRDAGFEPLPGELPDYLPMMLEFLAVCPAWAKDVLLDGFGSELTALSTRLTAAANPYTPLVQEAVRILHLSSEGARP